jgi:PAS domain S-box-containing protein
VGVDPKDVAHPSLPEDLDVYRALVEGIPAILYIDKPDSLSTNFYTSPQAVDLLGFTQEEWETEPELWVGRIHPEDRPRVLHENDRSNETGEHFLIEYRMVAKDERVVWVRDEAVMVYDDDGAPLHWRGIMLDITAQKEAEEKLRWSLDVLRRTIEQRRELAQRLEGAQEEERRRIAQDIHDDPIQVMSALDLRLRMLAEDPSRVSTEALEELERIVADAVERLRSLLFELWPTALEHEGLIASLRLYLTHSAAQAGWSVELHDELDVEPPSEVGAVVYRIAQEALVNVRKHAGASSVAVRVAGAGDGVTIRVEDDGAGFDVAAAAAPRPGHLGLSTMTERAELLGGWCRVTSERSVGTVVECWLPADVAREERLAAPGGG